MRIPAAFLLLFAGLAACGGSDPDANGWSREKRAEIALPVRAERPRRGAVRDIVETQAALETDHHVSVYAEVDGEVVERVRDLGDRVGEAPDGDDPLLLARIDDRELKLSLDEAEIDLKEKKGRIRELELERGRAESELEQAMVGLREAEAAFKRADEGIKDGTISVEEHERATFARNLTQKKVAVAQSGLDKAIVALELGAVAVERAQAARNRTAILHERATIRSPLSGVVTLCNVREGEHVRTGDLLYRVEDPSSLVIYGNLPVRQAARVAVGDEVILESNAVEGEAHGKIVLVAPTVERESGTIRVKAEVQPAPGFKPGLFVTMRIVVETRADALVVPRRAILHDDEEGPYLFVVREGVAERVLVRTGFEGPGVLEVEGVGEEDLVVVDGQDTLADGAKVALKEAPPAAEGR